MRISFLKSFFSVVFLFSVLFLAGFNSSFAETSQEQKARLQSELDNLEQQIKAQQSIISTTQAKSKSLANDVAALQAQINSKKLQIKQVDYKISLLSNQISDKDSQLETLNQKLAKQKVSLIQILKKSQGIDDTNFVNFVLDKSSLSEYFSSANDYVSLQSAINDSLNEIKNTSNEVTAVKNDLQDSKDSQLALKQQQELAAKNIASTQSQKNSLLKETKGQEAIYQKQLKDTQAAAAKIRSALFALAGGSNAISFGTALDLANSVSQNVDIEPAFLLAILTQESNLGANVGKCYLTDTVTGAGVSSSGKTFSNVMKPSRDVTPFISITSALGIDYTKQVVSCPIAGVAGYGGAMGPAQFIPSTWMIFDKRIKADTGASASNPWSNLHAFTASALYLTDLGATKGDYLSMIKAACKYYGTGGSNCSYGRQVMARRDTIQSNIDYLKQYGK